VASLIEGADAVAKTANLRLVEIRLAMAPGGKALVTLTGSVAAVRSAVDAGAAKIAAKGLLTNKVVIPNPAAGAAQRDGLSRSREMKSRNHGSTRTAARSASVSMCETGGSVPASSAASSRACTSSKSPSAAAMQARS
jgi:microcompartment protein CcmL/EutN